MKKSNLQQNILENFLSVLPHFSIPVFVVDEQGNILASNPLWLDVIGNQQETLSSISKIEISGSNFSQSISLMLDDIFSGKTAEETVVKLIHTNKNQPIYFKVSASLFQQQYAIFTAVDVSEEVKTKDFLLAKKKQFFSILTSLGDIVLKLDRRGNYKNFWAKDISKLFPRMDLMEGKNLKDHFPKKVVDLFLLTIERSASKGQPMEMEFSYSLKEDEKWFAVKIAPIYVEGFTEVEEFTAIIKENTEERINRKQNKYKSGLINQLATIKKGPILHIIKGNEPIFEFISGNLFSLTGYTDTELNEMNWMDVILQNDRGYVQNKVEELQNQGGQRVLVYRILTKEGDINWISNHITKAEDDGQAILFGVMLNVTEVHLLNRDLKQRDRILTQSGNIAKMGGWEYDVKNQKFHLTDEIYTIHERDEMDFDVVQSADYYIEEHRPIIKQCLSNLLKSGQNYDVELQLTTGNGNIKWIRSVGFAEWHNGQITHIFGILQDINEKKEKDLILQENERRFNTAFELAPIGIGLLAPNGRWIKVNQALSQFFELTEEQLKENNFGQLNLTDTWDKKCEWSTLINIKHQYKHQLEKKFLTASGDIKWGRISINPVKNDKGEPLYFIFQIVDITETKQFEENLIIAKKEAEDANKAKSDFLSTMSHEIRTPLYGVIGITNLLLEEINDANHREQLKALKFSSDSLLLLVNDILDFSKIKSGVLSLESKPFDLKRLAEAVRETHSRKARELGNTIMLEYDDDLPDQIVGDELRIGQVLNNVVNNAVKFTEAGTIKLTIKKLESSGNRHRIFFSVKDTGIGIPEEMHSRVFEQFIQAESGTSRKYGGTGLGLSIVKGLLTAMDSKISLTSELGKGTEISFELLLQEGTSSPAINPNEDKGYPKNLENKTILLVEDNPVSMMVAVDYINKWKGKVIKAINGLEAVENFKLNIDKIDLILMDLQMPLLNGFEAAEQIKKMRSDVPIIALTASIGNNTKHKFSNSGMVAYVIKPFNPDDFYKIIKTHLR